MEQCNKYEVMPKSRACVKKSSIKSAQAVGEIARAEIRGGIIS
jgi:hypothetical protein